MLSLPQRTSLVPQTLAILRQSLSDGRWQDWLPPERELADLFKISRPTLRLALRQLAREKLVRAEHGRGYRLLAARSANARQTSRILHLLSPDPVYTLRHRTVLWIEALHDRIRAAGGDLVMHHGEQFARERPEAVLKQLLARNPQGAWVLAHSTRAMQRWFAARDIPCVVAGFPHDGVTLPYVAVHMDAVARHAVGVLVRHGHRCIAYLGPRTDRAGDRVAEAGFRAASEALAARGIEGRVIHSSSVQTASICHALERLMRGNWRPTAIIVASAETYATVATHLPRLGLQVPRDVSLIAREKESLLTHLVPEPCSYAYAATRFGERMSRLVEELWGGAQPSGGGHDTLILCDYVSGDSVAARRD